MEELHFTIADGYQAETLAILWREFLEFTAYPIQYRGHDTYQIKLILHDSTMLPVLQDELVSSIEWF